MTKEEREDAIKFFEEVAKKEVDNAKYSKLAIEALEQEPKTGHWIKKEDDTCWWYVCSECEQEPLKNRWNDDDVLSAFCPYCGAKMIEPQESEE